MEVSASGGEDRPVDSLPAFDRVQEDDYAPPNRRQPAWKTAVLAFLVLSGVGGVIWALAPQSETSDNLLIRLVETSELVQPDLLTTRPEEAHDLVLNELGWSVPPPDFTGLALVGAAVSTVGEVKAGDALAPVPIELPLFRYEGGAGERVHVFAYDYILLDRVGTTFDLPSAAYAVLSEPNPVDSRVVANSYVISWRRRAMIFTAVTTDEAVAERIRQSVAR